MELFSVKRYVTLSTMLHYEKKFLLKVYKKVKIEMLYISCT